MRYYWMQIAVATISALVLIACLIFAWLRSAGA
jgi:hypothetical protein